VPAAGATVEEDGHSALPALLDDATAAVLEPLRLGLQPVVEALMSQHGVAREDIVALWTFTVRTARGPVQSRPGNPFCVPTRCLKPDARPVTRGRCRHRAGAGRAGLLHDC